jgi:hypothetical protein
MGLDPKAKDIILAGIFGGTVIFSASSVSAQCNETRAENDRLVHEWNDMASALVQTRIAYQGATVTFSIERARLIAEREHAWDRVHEESEAASECRIKMNREYGDPGWPVSDPIPVDWDSRYMWVWELACGPYVEETTCSTCLDDLFYAEEMANISLTSCDEVRKDDIEAACDGDCDQARAARGRCRRDLELASNGEKWWKAEATKLQEKYEPDKYNWEDTDG